MLSPRQNSRSFFVFFHCCVREANERLSCFASLQLRPLICLRPLYRRTIRACIARSIRFRISSAGLFASSIVRSFDGDPRRASTIKPTSKAIRHSCIDGAHLTLAGRCQQCIDPSLKAIFFPVLPLTHSSPHFKRSHSFTRILIHPLTHSPLVR